tara:strand:- start:257 stop:1291 length:1035 start_codon:yes stop_codon:yes gene_type:complete
MRSCKKVDSKINFRGVGGPKMKSRGLSSLVNFNRLAVMGFVEVFRDLLFFIKLKNFLIKDIKKHNPQKIILIDYPGFNLSLAKTIKKTIDIPVFFYISPQVWAWKETRVKQIKKNIDKLIVIFPFEKEWYKKRGVEVEFFGHPLIDLIKKQKTTQVKNQTKVVGLFPGSRKQEILKHLPILQQTMVILRKKKPEIKFILCHAPGLDKTTKTLLQKINVEKIVYNSEEAFQSCDAAIVTSGTATLECAISQTPLVVIYKTSIISWLIAKYFLSIPFISIVNIIANKKIVEECLQKNATPQKIASETLQLLKYPERMKENLSKVKNSLGHSGVYKKTAQFIINYSK